MAKRCNYGDFCEGIPCQLVKCQGMFCQNQFHHMCQGDYQHEMGYDPPGAEYKLCKACVDKHINEDKEESSSSDDNSDNKEDDDLIISDSKEGEIDNSDCEDNGDPLLSNSKELESVRHSNSKDDDDENHRQDEDDRGGVQVLCSVETNQILNNAARTFERKH